MDLQPTLESFFSENAPLGPGDTVLVAFSGGADSTALLLALEQFGRSHGVTVHAAHIDHGLDPGSSARALAAADTAALLGVPLTHSRHRVAAERRRGESLEMAARRVRYRELERIALELGARYVATAHHRDDQAETVLLRLGAGHDLAALSAIPARRGRIVRPLLGRSRRELVGSLGTRRCRWVEDPTNADVALSRNRVRRLVLPRLEATTPGLGARLARLARTASIANTRLSHVLDDWLEPRPQGVAVHVSRQALAGGPKELLPWAVTHVLRKAGGRRRPSGRALAHLSGLLGSRAAIAVDLGGGWRIEDASGGELRILRRPRTTRPFVYNLGVPGEVHLGELSSSFRLRTGRAEPWMFRGAPERAGLSLPLELPGPLTVRNRRPGDRVQPLGSSYRRKLKDLLIDHRIPRHERDRVPLLCHSDHILWVPGVTIDHEARITEHRPVWVAEIVPDE